MGFAADLHFVDPALRDSRVDVHQSKLDLRGFERDSFRATGVAGESF